MEPDREKNKDQTEEKTPDIEDDGWETVYPKMGAHE